MVRPIWTAAAFLLSGRRPQKGRIRPLVLLFTKEESDEDFIKRELAHLEALETVLQDLEEYTLDTNTDDNHDEWEEGNLDDLLNTLESVVVEDDGLETSIMEEQQEQQQTAVDNGTASLEQALLSGVVPVSAGVGSECLAGDFGWDPLQMSEKDYIGDIQRFVVSKLPQSKWGDNNIDTNNDTTVPQTNQNECPRPRALILRDYREAEIRHSRLAMLAAVIWPLQELLDEFVLDSNQFGGLLQGPVTLPYFPIIMTGIMLLLGYLDIYSQSVKDMDEIGEAFLPGDCFWDPLNILTDAPESMQRNMQERELLNGRAAMLAVACYICEELFTGKALIQLASNDLLLRPLYEIPTVQEWLDNQFALPSAANVDPSALIDLDQLDTIL